MDTQVCLFPEPSVILSAHVLGKFSVSPFSYVSKLELLSGIACNVVYSDNSYGSQSKNETSFIRQFI
jgi:hypothetical protein